MAARNALAAAPVLSQRGERMGTPNSDQDMLPDGFLKVYMNPYSKENFQVCHMATSYCVLPDMGWGALSGLALCAQYSMTPYTPV